MTGVSGKQRRREVVFFFFSWSFKDSEEDWWPWTDGVFEKLLRSFVISYVSATTASVFFFFFYRVFAFRRLVYILSLTQICLRSAVTIQAEGWVRWRGSRTTVRLRTGGKHKLSNHHLPALPKGSHLWNWWLNKSSHSESCNINTELKRKEVVGGGKHWIMDQFLKAYT